VSFLEKMYPLIKSRMDKAIAGGMPPDAKDVKSYQEMKTRSMQLQNGIEQGMLTEADYIEMN
jgi:hypothetical protein